MGNFNGKEGDVVDNRYLLNPALFPNIKISDLNGEERNSKSLRVFTLNVANFLYVPNWSRRSGEIARTMNELRPDLCGLQELCFLSIEKKSSLADLLRALEFIWFTVWRTGKATKVLNAVDKSQEGVGLVSRYEIVSSKTLDLPKTSDSKDKENQRLMVISRIKKRDTTIDFATTHLSLDTNDARYQLAVIRGILNDMYKDENPAKYAQIIMGDFNLLNNTDFDNLKFSSSDGFPEFQDAADVLLKEQDTFPSYDPNSRLDRIFFRALSFWPKDVSAGPKASSKESMNSDHLHLTAAFDIEAVIPLFSINSGMKLESGMILSSTDRMFNLKINGDWDIVLFRSCNIDNDANIIWRLLNGKLPQKFKPPCNLSLQDDGNMVYYDSESNVVWASNTWSKGYGPWTLSITRSNGNIIYTDADSTIVWRN